MELDFAELDAVTQRLKIAITAIVLRHRTGGEPLTWRLLYAIEEEAFQELAQSHKLNPDYVRMLQSSPMFPYPKTDEPVDFGNSNALPTAFHHIWDAYMMAH